MTAVAEQPLIAAIDIGSNSIKMTVGRPNTAGGVDEVGWASEVVRLGQGLDCTGELEDSRMEAAIETLKKFREKAEGLGASNVFAVATEATRAASNGTEFLQRAQDEAGIPIRVLGGVQEAELTFRGLSATSDLSGQVLVADVGGGSTELIAARDGRIEASTSIPLGSGRLTDRLIVTDPPTGGELESSEAAAQAALEAPLSQMKGFDGDDTRVIVVGGTGEFMARLVPDPANIDREAIRDVLARLSGMTAVALAQHIEIPEARARVLPAGIAIVAAIDDRVQPKRIEIGRSGVRIGLLLEAAESLQAISDKGGNAVHPNGKTAALSEGLKPPVSGDANADEPDFRQTMRSLIGGRWDEVWKAVPVALEGKDIEGVHDVRVASRRLRAAMDIAAPVFPKSWYRPLHSAAKEITGALGEVRDRDVLLEALQADRQAAPITEQPGIDRLIDRVERERSVARAQLEVYLQELLDGPLRNEVKRRFGSRDTRVGTGTENGKKDS